MKLNKQIPLLPFFFCNYKKEQMKTKPRFCLIKKSLKSTRIKNMQLINLSIVFKTCVPEFLTRPTFRKSLKVLKAE